MPGDANWSSRKLLLRCNGSAGSTTFADTSLEAQVTTALGNAQISTAQSKFGGSSALLDGAGDGLSVTADAALEFGTGDFTFEAWVYPTALSSPWIALFSTNNGTSGPTLYLRTSAGSFPTWYASTTVVQHQTAITINAWHHVAVVRASGVMAVYLNGVKSTSAPSWATAMPTAKPLLIGCATSAAAEPFTGHLGPVRVSNRAEYTATFTPPADAFPEGVEAPEARIAVNGPIGAVAVFAGHTSGHASADGPLGGPQLLGSVRNAVIAADGPLGSPQVLLAQRYAFAESAGPLGSVAAVAGHSTATVQAAGPLGAPSVLVGQRYAAIAANGPLSAPSALGQVPTSAVIAAAGPLGAPSVRAWHDFTGQVSETAELIYVCDLITPTATVRVPSSSWQATLQTEAANYAQCVVPAVLEMVDAVAAATEFIIRRRARLTNGGYVEHEMVRCPVQTRSFAQGARNYTATLAGYFDGFAADNNPPTTSDRSLTGIRTVTEGDGGMRVRCDVDWLLRPGMRALYGATPIVVDFINYYVPGNDQYMDIGERA